MYDLSYFEDENVPVLCFFTDQIHLAYRSHVGKVVNGKEKITHPPNRPCPFCEESFEKSVENMSKHTKICFVREGITYNFDKGDIISFQDTFKYMGNVPYTVYFDFETTNGNAGFFGPKNVCCVLLSDICFPP